MDPRLPAWALVLLGPALVFALGPAPTPEMPEKLCGHHFVRALVRVCGGPRWSTEARRPAAGGDREFCRIAQAGHELLGSSNASQNAGMTGVSCCSGWRDDICSMATLCWDLACSPCPRLLTITATTVQLPPTLHATAASVGVPNKIC
uniref:Insulin-like 3 n=1 Tax=Cercocebus atys TaxID=9531 RepID=A0A2K5LM03_CERAT